VAKFYTVEKFRHNLESNRMSINTKLVLLLTLAVGAVMLVGSFLSLRQREAALETALRDELRAHAVTLQIALEENYQNGRAGEAQILIDRLRENSRVYGVLLFDETGGLRSASQFETQNDFEQPPELAAVLQTGEPVEFVREIDRHKFVSIILPLRLAGGKRGAVEIVKPLALIETDIERARLSRLATTLLLLATIFLVVYVVLSRNLSRPILSLLAGARALGEGDLSHRVEVKKTGDELAQLAAEFNRMADNLEAQQSATLSEAETRLNVEKELRHSERLASIGRLAAGIAHELGAPLNVIDARAEQLIENSGASREKQIKNLTIIRTQASRITHIVRQLLNLARPYNLRFERIKLDDLIESALDGFDEQNDLRIERAAKNDWQISGDADYLRQVFVNIFQNARQAIDDENGGVLKIEIIEAKRDDEIFAAVQISDTGKGIAPEHLEKIFDPFYTTKDIGAGTGLGLAVSRRIVEEHGGSIEAADNLDGGATFTIYLPKLSTDEHR